MSGASARILWAFALALGSCTPTPTTPPAGPESGESRDAAPQEAAAIVPDVELPLVRAETGHILVPVTIGDHELFVTASIGYSTNHEAGMSPNDLLRDADALMYENKRKRRQEPASA